MATAAFKGESPFNGILEREHHESDFKWVFEREKEIIWNSRYKRYTDYINPEGSTSGVVLLFFNTPVQCFYKNMNCLISVFSAWFHPLFIIALQALSKLEMNLAFFDRREMAALLYHQVTLALFGLGRAGSIHLANILARCRSAHQCLAVHKQWGQMHTIDCTIQVHKI